MATSNDTLTNYCFLAALTENQNDLYNHVYVPICKRALSLYSLRGAAQGTSQDIQEIIKQEYGIDVPIIIVRKLIVSVFASLSRRKKMELGAQSFEHGDSFQLTQYSFTDLEAKYKKGLRDTSKLELAFTNYLSTEQIDATKLPAFTDFLDKNKRQIASFFKGNGAIKKGDIEETYIYHVQFLEYLDTSNDELFKIAEQLYLGTIVAGFLESGIDLEANFVSNEVYYLDTPLILRALNLQKEEETEPALELLNLIRSTGGTIKVLSVTLNELSDVISNAVDSYNNKQPITTINDACLRLGKNKAWLINIGAKIEEYVCQTLKISKENILTSLLEKFEKSPDVKALKETRKRKGNAFHDVAAYLFVREQRGAPISSFQKGKYWFVTTNYDLLLFNKEHAPVKGITEIALPDALTSMLWLKDPAKLAFQVKKAGLRELMATTLNEEIASKELIGEFEAAISSLDDVSEEDYHILLESVACQSAKKIANFNELVAQDKNLAKQQAISIVEKEKTRKVKQAQKIKEAQDAQKQEADNNAILSQRIKALEDYQNQSKTEIEKLSMLLKKQKKTMLKAAIGLIIAIILGYFAFWGFTNFSTILSRIINVILSGGGLWGFGSFLINLYKSIVK